MFPVIPRNTGKSKGVFLLVGFPPTSSWGAGTPVAKFAQISPVEMPVYTQFYTARRAHILAKDGSKHVIPRKEVLLRELLRRVTTYFL